MAKSKLRSLQTLAAMMGIAASHAPPIEAAHYGPTHIKHVSRQTLNLPPTGNIERRAWRKVKRKATMRRRKRRGW